MSTRNRKAFAARSRRSCTVVGGMALILKSESQALFSWDEKLGVFPWRTLPMLKVQSREKVGNKPEVHVRQALLQYRAIAWLGRVLIECRTLKEPVR
ncbi:hypothetical protein IWQ51_002823 [Labrenzia sp. EL_142]|nr:hypothetical protein [Labrenzia sp. EL_142]